jgi:hypothetical protein
LVSITNNPTTTIANDDISSNNNSSSSSNNNNNLLMPTTYDEALEEVKRLRAIKEALLEQKERDDRFVLRYQQKVAKSERMSKLRELIPRDLFVRQDKYDSELEKVYNWSGISDIEIADIYRRRLNDVKQYGASAASSTTSSIKNNNDKNNNNSSKDPYSSFREVPDFRKASADYERKINSSNISKLYDLQKKIAGNDGSKGHNNNDNRS